MKPAPSPALYQPRASPRYEATIEPTMPRMVVRMNPDGSLFPGIMNFATTPAKKPTMMVQIILILPFLLRDEIKLRGEADCHRACICQRLSAALAKGGRAGLPARARSAAPM